MVSPEPILDKVTVKQIISPKLEQLLRNKYSGLQMMDISKEETLISKLCKKLYEEEHSLLCEQNVRDAVKNIAKLKSKLKKHGIGK
jgi:hypothetical protein